MIGKKNFLKYIENPGSNVIIQLSLVPPWVQPAGLPSTILLKRPLLRNLSRSAIFFMMRDGMVIV
jgi:hypothetical protein